jgi:hypothetical protein
MCRLELNAAAHNNASHIYHETKEIQMDIETFTAMVKSHDLTYMYSDDPRWYRAGRESLNAIESAAKELDRATAVRIWNENVERRMANPGPSQFHWNE